MDDANNDPAPHHIRLSAGSQAVINGALVTAMGPCELEVGAGSFVVTGRALDGSTATIRNPREELYFSMLEASIDDSRFIAARFRLFSLLAQVVAQDRTYQGQRECAACAASIMAGEKEKAVRFAARLASDRFGESPRGSSFETKRAKHVQGKFFAKDVRA
ncbi:MAG: hypothetical protein AAGK01_01965 [Pseudomonadota bacterium]